MSYVCTVPIAQTPPPKYLAPTIELRCSFARQLIVYLCLKPSLGAWLSRSIHCSETFVFSLICVRQRQSQYKWVIFGPPLSSLHSLRPTLTLLCHLAGEYCDMIPRSLQMSLKSRCSVSWRCSAETFHRSSVPGAALASGHFQLVGSVLAACYNWMFEAAGESQLPSCVTTAGRPLITADLLFDDQAVDSCCPP